MSRDDDLLERAARALRATPPPNDGELALAKQRMLAAHKAASKGGSRARTLRWVLPLAAVLAAGTALAAVPHGVERLAAAINRMVGFEILASAPRLAEPSKAKTARPGADVPKHAEPVMLPAEPTPAAEAIAPAPAEPAASEPASSEPAQQPLKSAARPVRSRKQEAAPAAVTPQTITPEPVPVPSESSEPAPVASADLAKYRAAHKAHFQQRDFALALRGWEAYLRQFPNGTFAIEARYNRAICLLHMGRKDEARRALNPFAHGEIGRGYRQAEATKLLEALE